MPNMHTFNIVTSYKNGNTGPNFPGDVDRWDYYPGHDWEENGLKMWQEANMTVECSEQSTFWTNKHILFSFVT